MPASPVDAPIIVLDTNVVLDWLVFLDPGCAALGGALEADALAWTATTAMREEFYDVLARPVLQARHPDPTIVAHAWTNRCKLVDPPVLAGPMARIRCTDPDDQMFVELALGQKARWLLTRDRALLALAPPLKAHGITVATPARWAARDAVR